MEITINDIIEQARRKNHNTNSELIEKAYKYASKKHENQLRKSGEAYIIHPLHVAYTLAVLGLDTQTICAALLHDVVEDTNSTYEDIEELFSEEIANIVEGVTKLSELFKTVEEKQAKNYKKMFIAMEKDIRVIILKLADRLHNISTLQHLKRDRQIAIATETIELYAPIAHKLGMYDMKMQLQDGAFKYLYPEEYKKITNELNKKLDENIKLLEDTKRKIETELKRQKIPAIVNIETKHIYNIYKKIIEKKISIEEIKDLFAIKIITKEKTKCYMILGIINTIYNIIPNSFKDYIATPRNNMYQAIHEIILGKNGVIFEVQICSYKMNKIAKYGITNYFPYMKEPKSKKEEINFKENLKGIHDSLELENIIEDPKEFLKTLKGELFDDEIYIFTPKGDIKVLPKGATAIDFAYLIHNEVGNCMLGCKINNRNMPIITKLENGNIVEIITTKDETKVQKEWLDIVKTAKAKSQIVKKLSKMKEKENNTKKIEIVANNKEDLILEITKEFTKKNININSLNTNLENKNIIIEIMAEIIDNSVLQNILENILNIKNVKKASIQE